MNIDPNTVLQLLGGILGQGNPYQRVPYRGMPANFASSFSYYPGTFETIYQQFFPFAKRLAPPTVLQHDWQTMIHLSQLRSDYMSKWYMNPMAIRAIDILIGKNAGRKFTQFMNQYPTISQWVIQPLLSNVFGMGAAGQKQLAFEQLSKYFTGMGYIGRTGMGIRGMPMGVAGTITERLFQLGYKDKYGLFKKFPYFNLADLSDIMRMGMDYGMRVPTYQTGKFKGKINLNKLMDQTRGLAKVIDAGMAVFHTMDKEKVIQNILEITMGRIPLTNTSQIQNVLYKISAVANYARVSTSYVARIAKENAQLFEQLGVGGAIGAQIGIGVPAMINMYTKGVVGGMRPIFTPQQVANLGGVQRIRARFTAQLASNLASQSMNKVGLFYWAAGKPAVRLGMTREEIVRQIQTTENEPGVNFLQQGKEKVRKYLFDKNLKIFGNAVASDAATEEEMRQIVIQGKREFVTDILKRGGVPALQRIANLAQIREVGRYYNQNIDIDRIRRDEAYRKSITNLLTTYYRANKLYVGDEHKTAVTRVQALMVADKDIKQQHLQLLSNRIMAEHEQNIRKRTSIFTNFKTQLAFTENPTLKKLFLSTLPGTIFNVFKGAPKNLTDIFSLSDAIKIYKGLGYKGLTTIGLEFGIGMEDIPEAKILRSMGAGFAEFAGYNSPFEYMAITPITKAIKNEAQKNGMSPSEYMVVRGKEYLSTLIRRVSNIGDFNKQKTVKNMEDSLKALNITGYNLYEARTYFSDKKSWNFKTFLGYINKLRENNYQGIISYQDAIKDSHIRSAFIDYMTLNQDNNAIKSSIRKAKELVNLNIITNGKLFKGITYKQVISKKDIREYLSQLSSAEDINKFNIMVDNLKSKIVQYNKTETERQHSFRKLNFETQASQLAWDRAAFAEEARKRVTEPPNLKEANTIIKNTKEKNLGAYLANLKYLSDALKKSDETAIETYTAKLLNLKRNELPEGIDLRQKLAKLYGAYPEAITLFKVMPPAQKSKLIKKYPELKNLKSLEKSITGFLSISPEEKRSLLLPPDVKKDVTTIADELKQLRAIIASYVPKIMQQLSRRPIPIIKAKPK